MSALRDFASGGPRMSGRPRLSISSSPLLQNLLQRIAAFAYRDALRQQTMPPFAIIREPAYIELYRDMYEVGIEARRDAGRRLYAEWGKPGASPNPYTALPFSEKKVLAKAADILQIAIEPTHLVDGARYGRWRVENTNGQRPVVAALQVLPSQSLPTIWIDGNLAGDEKTCGYVYWEMAILMGWYVYGLDLFRGMGTPGGLFASPDPRDPYGRALLPPLHNFARALLHRPGPCPIGLNGRSICGCNELEDWHNAAPESHQQDSTYLPARDLSDEIARTSGMPMPPPITPPTLPTPDGSTPPPGIRQRRAWNEQHTPRPGLDDEGEF